jgi:hypothetical protein
MSPKAPYSLSKAIRETIISGSPSGLESEMHFELMRQGEQIPSVRGLRGLGVGAKLSVPMEAFGVVRRDVSVGGGNVLFGLPKREELGLLRWSAVARSGAQVVDGLTSNVSFFHASKLPPVTWTAEIGAILPADPDLVSTEERPFRVASQVAISKQLSIQTGRGADEFVSREIGRALGAALDQAALYGDGVLSPRGVLNTPGAHKGIAILNSVSGRSAVAGSSAKGQMDDELNNLANEIATAARNQAVKKGEAFVKKRTRELIETLVSEISKAALSKVPDDDQGAR